MSPWPGQERGPEVSEGLRSEGAKVPTQLPFWSPASVCFAEEDAADISG